MKKVILAIAVAGMLTACNGVKTTLSSTENQTEENRGLRGFERIELLGSIDVKYQQADSFSVLVKAPAEVMKDVETRVDGNKLVVNMKGENNLINFGVADSRNVTVFVTSPDFIGIELKGSGDFDCEQLLDTDILDISLNGSGDIDFDNVICDQVNVSLVGSGDVELKQVKALRSDIELVGSGDIEMTFNESGSVDARLTGSGDIELKGTVRELKSQVRGSGDIQTEKLRVGSRK